MVGAAPSVQGADAVVVCFLFYHNPALLYILFTYFILYSPTLYSVACLLYLLLKYPYSYVYSGLWTSKILSDNTSLGSAAFFRPDLGRLRSPFGTGSGPHPRPASNRVFSFLFFSPSSPVITLNGTGHALAECPGVP